MFQVPMAQIIYESVSSVLTSGKGLPGLLSFRAIRG
jgi:hypothetical protein